MERREVIEPCSSHWASAVIFVVRKDGSMKFCVYYRQLNNVTVHCLDPRYYQCFGWIHVVFHTELESLVLAAANDPVDREKTASTLRTRLWLCLSIFERLMESV